jgi:hypothetical protein
MHQLIDVIFVTKSKEIEEVVERNNIKFTEYKKQQWETNENSRRYKLTG